MTKRASLDRLCDISKRRSIRRPRLAQGQDDRGQRGLEVSEIEVEWPIPN